MSYAQVLGYPLGATAGGTVKAGGKIAFKEYLKSNPIAAMAYECVKDGKFDKAHFKSCAKAAARMAASGYCQAKTGSSEIAELCGSIASDIAGPVAGAIYDAGDALVTGLKDVFGGGGTECGCSSCFWGKCWSNLSEPQKLTICEQYEQPAQPGVPRLGAPAECPQVRARRGAARLDAVTRVSASYQIWIKSMVQALNGKLLPELVKLGKPNVPFTPAYVEALVAKYQVSPEDAGVEVPTPAPAWWSQPTLATKPTGYGWFKRPGWDAPISIAAIIADPYAVARADIWAKLLLAVEPLVFADIISQIGNAVSLVSHKKLVDFAAYTAARQASERDAAKVAALVLLASAAAAGIVIYRRRKK